MILENKFFLKNKCFLLLFVFCLIFSCEQTKPYDELSGSTFGTYYNIKFFSNHKKLVVQKDVDSIFSLFNNSLSTYIESSTISKLNKGLNTELDNLFIDVFNKSKIIYRKSEGMFDPSIGLLIEYYGFGPRKTINKIDDNKISLIMQSVGFNKLSVRENKLIKQNLLTKLDFNAIAKGYAVDKIAEILENKGIEDYMINIGGEIRSMGRNHYKDSFWKIGIENPDPSKLNNTLIKKIKLNNISIASSGNYRNFRVDSISKKKYVHTINPTNGKSEETNILSASVLAKSCFIADAYATAFMAGNLDYIKRISEGNDEIESFIVYIDSNNNLSEYITDGFRNVIITP